VDVCWWMVASGSWVAKLCGYKLVAHLLATAALWVRVLGLDNINTKSLYSKWDSIVRLFQKLKIIFTLYQVFRCEKTITINIGYFSTFINQLVLDL
jgi:hypothetical protein